MVITLKNQSETGQSLEVTYLPEKGLNMISYKKGSLEIIDQSTKNLFEERFAGLGALIGPHFHRKKVPVTVKDESLFPHIEKVKENGVLDPFSHGIARYAPWTVVMQKEHYMEAVLTGKDLWQGIALSELEGQNFKMTFKALLLSDGLHIDYSVVSDTDSLVGLHYYYNLPKKEGTITAKTQNWMIEKEEKKQIPLDVYKENEKTLFYPLNQETDLTFYPFPDPLKADIFLDAIDYKLHISYESPSQENSFQLYHPKDSSFVCIEPISAQDPRHPNLTVSSLKVKISIL